MSNCGVCFILKHYLDSFGRDVECESCGTLWRIPLENRFSNVTQEDSYEEGPSSRPHSRASSGDSSGSSNYQSGLSNTSARRKTPVRRKSAPVYEDNGRPPKQLLCPNPWCTYHIEVKKSERASEGLLKSHIISCQKNKDAKRRYKSVVKSSGMKSGIYVPYEQDAFEEALLDSSTQLAMIKSEPVEN
ncbi:Oidioi.mRNA.OKI2018_I69.PAR.g13013.t1.cds [Oikopleura dioica]|uniref:Oidioi.mRNA.OKI2018_I69.PAR.g13013.t1.cds n=1 Tax=Oikopleura dioica TaxID=34765 RepID=A0ABN7S7E9_OIKDI|nr:Oidioi.mRNA.OKI2018_I69.PAR.g13013.t1.cds [Oikopleura dioica]